MRISSAAKRIFFTTCWILAGAGFVILLTAAGKKQQAKVVGQEPQIFISHEQDVYFIDEAEVEAAIRAVISKPLSQHNIHELDLEQIEKAIKTNPYTSEVEVYTDAQGMLGVSVEQRQPIVRVINRGGVSYYLDQNGEKIPITGKFTSRVPVATGEHFEEIGEWGPAESDELKDLYKLAVFLDNREVLKALTDQIYLNENREFEIISKIGHQVVKIGSVDDLEKKFDKLLLFYEQVLPEQGWESFSELDIRFENQVVAKK